jgi:histidinol dehydrogenase
LAKLIFRLPQPFSPLAKERIMKRLSTQSPQFQQELQALLAFETAQDPKIDQIVADICADVQRRGDVAVIAYTNQFDGTQAQTMADLTLSQDDLKAAFFRLPENVQTALKTAAERVESYHQHQKQASWSYTDADGTLLGQQITPLDRVGIYVPGGKAAYPSSVIMNAMPAHVAGVPEIIMVVPTPQGERNDIVLAAAYIAGVTKVYTIGGAQAVAALAYGTQTVPQVDKITGPGNAFVAAAKRRVFGVVGIDMVAGPSEILVIADGSTPADWVAMDLFSQAEHDKIAQAILIATSPDYLDEVQAAMHRLMPTMPRRAIIEASLSNRGAMILAKDLDEACAIANYIAPEHLELSVENAEAWAKKIRHAGAIFMGRYTSESLGDYCAGPNHVLPTSRTARFSSPLGTYDFQKRSSLIQVSEQGAQKLGKIASVLAHGESLTAHARAAEFRLKD